MRLAGAGILLLGQGVDTVAAVIGKERICRVEVRSQCGLRRLLADARMQHARHIALLELALKGKFKGAYQPHVAIQINQRLGIRNH